MSQITNTLFIGKVLQELTSCNSTNSVAKERVSNSEPIHGTVIYTDNQTEGRGQFGNTWQSEAGKNIQFSIILKPSQLSLDKQFYLSKVVSIGICEALREMTNLDFEIKWPNDIYLNNKKIGGILIENQLRSNVIHFSIVGIGINVNQEEFSDLPNASSLYLSAGYLFNKQKVLSTILKEIEVNYFQLTQEKWKKIDEKYHQLLKYYQQNFKFIKNGQVYQAKLIEVLPSGQLVVEHQKGQKECFSFKEIEWIL